MTADDTATNGTSEPKTDETAPIEKDSEAPEMEGSAKENGEPTPKASSPKKAKKGKKGKKGSKAEEKAPEGSATENGETKTEGDPDIEIIGEKKKKPIKKKIPHWATLSDSVAAMAAKGQLISKCSFGVFKSPKKISEIFSRISAIASKKRSNHKSGVRVKIKSSY